MGIESSVSVIFDTEANCSYSSNKGDFVELEDKHFPRNIKGIKKAWRFLDLVLSNIISGLKVGVLFNSVIRNIMFIGYQSICASFPHKAFSHQKYARVPS